MLRRNFKNRYSGSGNAVEVDPGYRHKLQRKLRPQSTRRRNAAASSIIFCSDATTFRSLIPENIFRSARSRLAANLGGVCGERKLWAGMADYTGDCHRAAHCAEPLDFDPPYGLATEARAIERFGNRDKKLPNNTPFMRGAHATRISAKLHHRIERMRTNRFPDRAENDRSGIRAAAHVMIADLGRLSRAGRAAGSGGLRLRLQSALRADRIRQRLDVSLSADELSGIPNHVGGRPRKKGHASPPRRVLLQNVGLGVLVFSAFSSGATALAADKTSIELACGGSKATITCQKFKDETCVASQLTFDTIDGKHVISTYQPPQYFVVPTIADGLDCDPRPPMATYFEIWYTAGCPGAQCITIKLFDLAGKKLTSKEEKTVYKYPPHKTPNEFVSLRGHS